MQLSYTIWALLMNIFGLSIFKSCFTDAKEDEFGDSLLSGPPITCIIFTTGVYIILINSTLYPAAFRQPHPFIVCIYEFLTTSFLLEFAVACVWTPIDLLIYTSAADAMIKPLIKLGYEDAAKWIMEYKFPMVALCYLAALGFLTVALYITNSIDFTLYAARGPRVFSKYLRSKVLRLLTTELPPELNDDLVIRKKNRIRKISKKITTEGSENN